MDISMETSLERREEEKVEEEKQNESGEGNDTSVASDDVTAAGGEDNTLTTEDLPQQDTSGEFVTPVPVKRKRGRPPLSAKKAEATPKRKARPSSGIKPSKKNNENELFLCVLEGKSALQSVVDEWVERYQNDSKVAILELVQYFVRCSGCQAKISLGDFHTQGATSIIRNLTENFAEDSFDYPLVISGPQYKKFKSNYGEFVIRLIEGCGDIIYDEYMLDTLVNWMIGLSDSQVRAFRHTSTLACLKMVTGLVQLATSVSTDIDNTHRQCETERRKSSSRKMSGKLSKLQETLAQFQTQLDELQEMIKNLFTSVFVRRYRDIRPEIRAICIAELGVWIKEYSSHFLADQYLKYIGWTLSDKVGEVRLHSLQALVPLYSTPDYGPHLELFTKKFKERLVGMRLDKEDAVSSTAINLCIHLLWLDMLEPEECVELCELVFMDNKSTARAAGKFAVHYLFSEDFMTKARSKPSKGHKAPTDAQIKLREIVKFFIEVKIHEHAECLVDSFWEHTDVLKDWETMIGLLTITSRDNMVLSEEEEPLMIELLGCAVRKAAGVSLIKGKNKQLTAKEKRTVEVDKHDMSALLIPVIPQLISKYGTDVECAINLSSIPQQFELEIFVEVRGQKHLEDLLEQLKDLTLKHSDQQVLEEVAITYSHLLDPEFTLHSVVDVAFSQLCDELFADCNERLEAIEELPLSDSTNVDVFNLSVNLERIATLFKQVNMNKWLTSIDRIIHLVELGVDESACDMLVIPSVNILSIHLLWLLQSLDFTTPDRNQCRSIRTLTNQVVTLCSDLVKLGSSAVQQEAYVLLCDLLIVFARQLTSQGDGDLSSLVYTPDYSLQSSLCDYVMERVFNDSDLEEEPTNAEEAYQLAEKLNNRRNLLAGYLKLVVYSVVETDSAVSVLGQYVKYFSDYGDLIRYAFTRIRESTPVNWYHCVLKCLQTQYEALKGDGEVDYTSSQWADLKDLARRIALTTGFDLVKCRLAIVGIHHEGINYAFYGEEEEPGDDTPERIDFLEILSEFSFRLLDIDKHGEKGILALLQDKLSSYSLNVDEADKLNGAWEPLANYITTLTTSNNNQEKGGEGGEPQEPAKKKGKTVAKRKRLSEGDPPPAKSKRISPSEE